MKQQKGFFVLEVLLASALFVIFSAAAVGLVLQGFDANRTGNEETIANQYASEGIEAVRSIENQDYIDLVSTASAGVARGPSNTWIFSGTTNTLDKYTRSIAITDVQRDGSGNIVASGGTNDPNTRKVTVTVSWNVSPTRNNSVVLTEYLTNWRRRGMLIYGDGGTTTDAMKYQVLYFDGTWSSPANMADVDGATTNKAARAMELYSSSTRIEKIAVSRHFDGTGQYIYAQVYNGKTWGNVQLLSNWNANTHLNVRNFDGAYLANGDFMVIYSDNTFIPKMRIWNGSAWSAQSSLTTLGNNEIPTWVRARARPGTNEVMALFETTAQDGISQYWSGSAWSAITVHATSTFNVDRQGVDFTWSTNTPTIGVVSYQTSGGDKTPRAKLFQADGIGSGTWGAQFNGADTAAAGSIVEIVPRNGANEFGWCRKDAQAAPDITCRKITFVGTTGTFTTPTNAIITANTTNGVHMTFGIAFESASADPALIVYSDNTATPKYKKYNAATATWDAAATSLSTLGGVVQTVKVIPEVKSDDMMATITDANLDLYTIIWDGFNTQMYATPSGRALTLHGTNGSAATDLWYDFAWDTP